MIERFKRFGYLPFIIVAAGIIMSLFTVKPKVTLPSPELETNVRTVMWDIRRLDMVGQVIILLGGVFGVVILFKERGKK